MPDQEGPEFGQEETEFTDPLFPDENPGEEQPGLSLEEYMAKQGETQDATPEYVSRQPDQPIQTKKDTPNPNQVDGPDSPKPTERRSTDEVSGHIGNQKLGVNPGEQRIDSLSGSRTARAAGETASKATAVADAAATAKKTTEAASNVAKTATDIGKDAGSGHPLDAAIDAALGSSKTGRAIGGVVKDVKDIAEALEGNLIAAAGAILRRGKSVGKLFIYIDVAIFILACVVAFAFFLIFTGGLGSPTRSLGIPSTSRYSVSALNPKGISLDVMSDHLDINDPTTGKFKVRLTVDGTAGLFSCEKPAQRQSSGTVLLMDDNSCKDGNPKTGPSSEHISSEGQYYDITTGKYRTMTADELKWYVTARWGYSKGYWGGGSVPNPAEPSQYFWGREIVIYSLTTGRAAVGEAGEYGPAAFTGVTHDIYATQEAAWKQGPNGPEPRLQVPPNYMGRIAGGAQESFGSYLGVNNTTDAIVVGFLRSDLQGKVPLGPLTTFQVLTHTATPTGAKLSSVPLYKQGDYADIPYPGDGNSANTISSSGCGIVSAAMVLSYYGNTQSPRDLISSLASYAIKNNYRRNDEAGTDYGFFPAIAKDNNLQSQDLGTNWDKIMSYLKQGTPVIVSGKGTTPYTGNGHFIVLTGVNGSGQITVNDPNLKSHRTPDTYSPDTIKKGMETARVIYK